MAREAVEPQRTLIAAARCLLANFRKRTPLSGPTNNHLEVGPGLSALRPSTVESGRSSTPINTTPLVTGLSDCGFPHRCPARVQIAQADEHICAGSA